MAVLLITYELKSSTKDYASFFKTIQDSSSRWWHYLKDTWIIETTVSADNVAKKLYPHMEEPDRLLVVRIRKDYQGWLAKDAWSWLNDLDY